MKTNNLAVFNQIITKCGIELDGCNFVQRLPTVEVINTFKDLLTKGHLSTYDTFKEILNSVLNNSEQFIIFLQQVKSNYDIYLFSTPKSMYQILLMIPELTNFLFDHLIYKVCELSQSNVDDDNKLAILCLDQFKWNIYNKNMGDIIGKLLDLGYIANNIVQNHLITIFPYICQGKYNDVLAQKLFDWMSTNNNLISSSLEAINKLDLPDYYLKDVEELITGMLDSASMTALPSIINFLIKSSNKIDQINLIDKIRLNVEFDNLQSMFCSAVSSTPKNYISTESSSAVKLINSIRINLQFNPTLRKAWLKSISNKHDLVRSENFDFVVLLIISHEYPSESGLVVNLFKLQITRKKFNVSTIENLFKYHLSLLKPLYECFLNTMNALLFTLDSSVLPLIISSYIHCFSDPTVQFSESAVFDKLISEIGLKPAHVVSGVCQVLEDIALNLPEKLDRFFPQIVDLVTYRCELRREQISSLYRVLATIAFAERDPFSELMHENQSGLGLIRLVKSQLQNPDWRTRRNGALGALTIAQYLSSRSVGDDSVPLTLISQVFGNAPSPELDSDPISVDSVESEQNSAGYRAVSIVIRLLLSFSATVPDLVIVVFDELSGFIERGILPPSVEKLLRKLIYNSFHDRFIIRISASLSDNSVVDTRFGIRGDYYSDLAVIVSQSHPLESTRKSINTNLPAHFRLLASVELRFNTSLNDINGLLGSPIRIAGGFEGASPAELLVALNWWIEVVNAFSKDSTGPSIAILVPRMKLIVSHVNNLHTVLKSQLGAIKLPVVDGVSRNGTNLVLVTEIRKKMPAKRRVKSSAKSKVKTKVNLVQVGMSQKSSILANVSEEELFEIDNDLERDDGKAEVISCKVLVEELSLCVRELDVSVFIALRNLTGYDLILGKDKDESLDWVEVQYFLSDLWLKIKHCMRDRTGFPAGFSSASNLKNSILFRYVDQLTEEVFVNKVLSISPLFKIILSKCTEFCTGHKNFYNPDDPCLSVLEILLRILAKIFHYLKNSSILDRDQQISNLLQNLASGDNSTSFVNHLLSISDSLPSIQIASSYCELVAQLRSIPEINSSSLSLMELTKNILSNNWNCTNNITFKAAVSKVFEIHLSALSHQWFDVISNSILPEILIIVSGSQDDTDRIPTYSCLDKSTLLGVFKQISEFVLKKCKLLSKANHSQRNTVDMLDSWEKIIAILRLLTKVITDDRDHFIMLYFIKFSRDFIKIVIKDLMPILDNMFRHENTQVIRLLTGIQSVTRFVQRLCTHCKSKNDVASASLVPQVRRYLETFMFRVKKMMCINKCSGDTIDILLLANKDLHGQRLVESGDSGKEEEESTGAENDNDGFSEDLENEILSDE